MNENRIETRRRSRSKTPFLRSQCDNENCENAGEEGHHQHTRKAAAASSPKVNTIMEESVEVTSSSSSPNAKKSQQNKIKTSDYSSDDTSPDKNKIINARNAIETQQQQQQQQQKQSSISATYLTTMMATTTTTATNTSSSTIITKNKKMNNNLTAAAATSTPKAKSAAENYAAQFICSPGSVNETRRTSPSLNEIKQNAMNTEFELSQQQQQQQEIADQSNHSSRWTQNNNSNSINNKVRRFLSNSFGGVGVGNKSSGDERSFGDFNNLSDHLAYREYKRSGEYWKNTPKTDYTYSELSPHRRELAPGIVAMPNMSRRSLENHHDRIFYMVERDPGQEYYIRRRYESSKYGKDRDRETDRLVYDSGDEVDQTQYDGYGKTQHYGTLKESWWFMRTITTIISTFKIMTQTVFAENTANGRGGPMYRSKIRAKKKEGVFGKIANGFNTAFFGLFHYISLFISCVLCLDTWLLRSSNADGKSKKRLSLLLLILLPLLLLTGFYYYLHPNESFPPNYLSQNLQTLTLPEIDLSNLINQAKYDAFKTAAYNRLGNIRDWTDDYLLYLKTISQNVVAEGRKYFQREKDHERV